MRIKTILLTVLIIIALGGIFASLSKIRKYTKQAKTSNYEFISLRNHLMNESFASYNETFNDGEPIPFDQLMNEVTIVVPSFDKYSELWDPFFTFLFKEWPDLLDKHKDMPIMLVSNFAGYENPRVHNVKVGMDSSWSDNLIIALREVKTKYVFIILEDYIINAPVQSERVQDMLHLLESTGGAYAEVFFDYGVIKNEKHKNYPQEREDVIIRSRGKDAKYRTSLQASLWNIKTLKKLLVTGESAWDFEIYGSMRSKFMAQPFYAIAHENGSIISYLNAAERGQYRKSVVEYINKEFGEFQPKKLPINPKL